ncbi:MAG: hypothetical protein ACTSV5_11560 [Promethearchaeota archaeon]
MSGESRQVLQKIFKVIPGPYWGLLSMIVGLLGDIIAVLMTPNYNLDYMVSYLGTGPGALFFNLGTILSGLFALLFYLYLIPILKSKNVTDEIHRTALVFAVLSCFFFMLIGFFPSITTNSVMIIVHGFVAMMSLMCGSVYKSLFGYMMLKNEKFLKLHTYSAMIIVVIEIAFLLTWIPIIEWMMVVAITYWIFMLSFHVFTKKEMIYSE